MITKNIKHIVAAFCVGCGIAATPALSSCSDYLDKEPDIELTTDMVFQNRDKVYAWLANIYNTIVHAPDKWSLTRDGYEVMADDVCPRASVMATSSIIWSRPCPTTTCLRARWTT